MPNIVYVLTNPAMPGLVKIGRSEQSIEARLRQLDTTGLPLPFECFCAVEVDNALEVERGLHAAFADHRVRQSREFFRLSPDKPLAILRLLERRKDVTPKGDVVESPDDQVALDAERRRRSNFSFDSVDIAPGTMLNSVFDANVTCVVASKKKVTFRGEEHSLSSAALMVAHENGFTWKAIQGPACWTYLGETLVELREDAEDG